VVLFTGAIIGFEEACKGLIAMTESGWNLRVLMSAAAEQVIKPGTLREKLQIDDVWCESEENSLSRIYEDVDLVIIPCFTLNSLAKSALGIADTAVTNVISHFLMMGTPMIAARDACDLDNPMREQLGLGRATPSYKNLYSGYREKLASYGVRFVSAAEIWAAVQDFSHRSVKDQAHADCGKLSLPAGGRNFTKNILTRIDLLENTQDGIILIGEHVRVTDAAKDTATQLNIEIHRG